MGMWANKACFVGLAGTFLLARYRAAAQLGVAGSIVTISGRDLCSLGTVCSVSAARRQLEDRLMRRMWCMCWSA